MKRQNTSPLLVVTDPSVIAVEGVPGTPREFRGHHT